ncbi:hypothetical protein HO173_011149 [Letharia columbiana]|uniref:Uncharacterized protein n=1 Tax=Letharia columbiana TaxID=112416 RepID=A0A8H6L076_9LECA|nr:uncharacterized protein HO173_011149 [Letharia columbiana]KAF6230612.1 hypothetical protein HO173_011149 [Letharia columbiana]
MQGLSSEGFIRMADLPHVLLSGVLHHIVQASIASSNGMMGIEGKGISAITRNGSDIATGKSAVLDGRELETRSRRGAYDESRMDGLDVNRHRTLKSS